MVKRGRERQRRSLVEKTPQYEEVQPDLFAQFPRACVLLGMIRETMHSNPSLLAENIPSTGMNSCPGMDRSVSSVPSGNRDPRGGRSGICSQSAVLTFLEAVRPDFRSELYAGDRAVRRG